MKKAVKIISISLLIVLLFFISTNPSTDSLKRELPGMLALSPDEMKYSVTIAKISNWFVCSKFVVHYRDPNDNHFNNWDKEYWGIAGNFNQIMP